MTPRPDSARRLARAEAEARLIARRLLTTDVSAKEVAREYGIADSRLLAIYRAATTAEEREAARGRKRNRSARIGGRLPFGTIRARACGSRSALANFIKVRRPDGSAAWELNARHAWAAANGRPVPDGYVVEHANGDRLDDSAANLVLRQPIDSLRRAGPEVESRRRAAVVESLRRTNAERGVMRRAARLYPVAVRAADDLHAGMPAHVERDEVRSAAVDGLIRACRTWRPDGGASPETHAYNQARFAVLTWARWRLARRAPAPLLSEPPSAPPPEPAPDDAWDRLLSHMDPEHAQLISRVFRQGMTIAEAATRARRSPAWGTRAMALAIRAVRSRWGERELAKLMGLPAG